MVTKIVNRSLWVNNKIQCPEGIIYEDNTIGSLCLMYANKLVKVDEALYFYRDNHKSTTHIVDNRYLDRLKSAELFLGEYKKIGLYDELSSEVEFHFISLYFLNSYRKIARKFNVTIFMRHWIRLKN